MNLFKPRHRRDHQSDRDMSAAQAAPDTSDVHTANNDANDGAVPASTATIIAEGSEVTGELHVTGRIDVHGTVHGSVSCDATV